MLTVVVTLPGSVVDHAAAGATTPAATTPSSHGHSGTSGALSPPMSPTASNNHSLQQPPPPRKAAVMDFAGLAKASDRLYASDQAGTLHDNAAVPLEEVRKTDFPDQITQQYRRKLLKKARRISTLQDYYAARGKTLQEIEALETTTDTNDLDRKVALLPRKPKVPKPRRRMPVAPGKPARPNRFDRRINRMLKKIWKKENALPVVEESLRDFLDDTTTTTSASTKRVVAKGVVVV